MRGREGERLSQRGRLYAWRATETLRGTLCSPLCVRNPYSISNLCINVAVHSIVTGKIRIEVSIYVCVPNSVDASRLAQFYRFVTVRHSRKWKCNF
jgi:hypothetical protein